MIQRGNNRSACFFAREDYSYYLANLAELADKHNCAVHAYCLMTNHFHLLLTPDDSLAPGHMMKALGQRYVQYVNRTYRRSGTLWEGRYRSSLLQDEVYLLVCHRYIELNPVRASMVDHPGDYPWSSYRANAQGETDPVLTPHDLYLSLGASVEERLASYRELFRHELPPGEVDQIRQATNGNFTLGNQRFITEVEATLGIRAAKGTPGRPSKSQEHKSPVKDGNNGVS